MKACRQEGLKIVLAHLRRRPERRRIAGGLQGLDHGAKALQAALGRRARLTAELRTLAYKLGLKGEQRGRLNRLPGCNRKFGEIRLGLSQASGYLRRILACLPDDILKNLRRLVLTLPRRERHDDLPCAGVAAARDGHDPTPRISNPANQFSPDAWPELSRERRLGNPASQRRPRGRAHFSGGKRRGRARRTFDNPIEESADKIRTKADTPPNHRVGHAHKREAGAEGLSSNRVRTQFGRYGFHALERQGLARSWNFDLGQPLLDFLSGKQSGSTTDQTAQDGSGRDCEGSSRPTESTGGGAQFCAHERARHQRPGLCRAGNHSLAHRRSALTQG